MTTAIDLSKLPKPTVVEQILAADIRDAMLAAVAPALPGLLPSDPTYKQIESGAYRETLLRQRVNEASLALMLAYAAGSDLDQLGALFNVVRLLLDAGNPAAIPPIAPSYERDAAFRLRIQQSFEGLSIAGPAGAYRFHALSADGDVQDVGVQSPNPCEVLITVLSRTGTGTAGAPLLAAVSAALNADAIRPIGDRVTVQSAAIVNYAVTAVLTLRADADSSLVLPAANAQLDAYVEAARLVGVPIALSALYAALHVEGVASVALSSPAAAVAVSAVQAAHCTAKTVTVA